MTKQGHKSLVIDEMRGVRQLNVIRLSVLEAEVVIHQDHAVLIARTLVSLLACVRTEITRLHMRGHPRILNPCRKEHYQVCNDKQWQRKPNPIIESRKHSSQSTIATL